MDPFKSFEAALPNIIAESPSSILRYRELVTDTFREGVTYTAGPYTMRIEPFRQATTKDIWDEKGGVAILLFQAAGHNLPRTVIHAGLTVPLFQLNDTITDQHGNTYRIAAPPYWRGKMVQLTLELRG